MTKTSQKLSGLCSVAIIFCCIEIVHFIGEYQLSSKVWEFRRNWMDNVHSGAINPLNINDRMHATAHTCA